MTFDRQAIIEWLKKSNKSPVTNLPLPDLELRPNLSLRNAIEEWVAHENKRAQPASLKRSADEPKQAKTGQWGQKRPRLCSTFQQGQKGKCQLLHDDGWRRLAARAGVLGLSVLIFDDLRKWAEEMLTVLVEDAVQLCEHDRRTTVLVTDILRAALQRRDNGKGRNGACGLVPLGSGFLGQALSMSCRAPCAGGIDWAKAATSERVAARLEVAEDANGDQDSQEEAGSDQEEEEEEEAEVEEVDEVEGVEAVKLRMIRDEQKKARRMIRMEQKMCGIGESCVFDFLSFFSCLQEMDGSRDGFIGSSDLSWEANAVSVAYHLLEEYMIELLSYSNREAIHAKRYIVWPKDGLMARACMRR